MNPQYKFQKNSYLCWDLHKLQILVEARPSPVLTEIDYFESPLDIDDAQWFLPKTNSFIEVYFSIL
jgi:hypothetical protein